MDTKLFDIFRSVAQQGSFSAAARARGADPSAVSRQIAALEADLGYRLFDRSTRRLSLTEAGRLTLDRIQPLLDEIEQVRQAAADSVSAPTGRLRVSASVAFGERWLIPRIGSFRDAFPGIDLDLVLTDTRVDLHAEKIDLALRMGARMDGPYVAAKLMPTRYRIVASPARAAALDPVGGPGDLAGCEAIVFPYRGFGAKWTCRPASGTGKAVSVPVRDVLTISNALAARRAALDGLGVALLADWLIGDDLSSGDLVDLLPDHEAAAADFDTAVWLLWPEQAHVPARTRAMIDHLKSAAVPGPS